MWHIIVSVALAIATFGTSLTAAWYWLKSSRVDIGDESLPSASDVPEAHILETQVAIMQSSRPNAVAAKWTGAAAVLGAMTAIRGAF
jgi:hypothetical protein